RARLGKSSSIPALRHSRRRSTDEPDQQFFIPLEERNAKDLTKPNSSRPPQLSFWRIFPLIFTAIFLLHAPLLRLPFFWDEAGFYVPAAYDVAHFHALIPKTTMDTGHPPLSAAYLAQWFTLGGWKPAVARVAMLLLAAFALTNIYLL